MLHLGNQSSNMRQQLDGKLVTSLEESWRVFGCPDTRRRASEDNRSSREGGSLREETDQLGDAEDEIAITVLASWVIDCRQGAYVNWQSCITLPFFNPRILNWLASGKWAAETIAGPVRSTISKNIQ